MVQRRGSNSSSDEPTDDGSAVVETFPSDDAASVPRWTTGRECWVFRAERPDQLCGYHPQLMASALVPRERLDYLLYAPVCDAKGGPFAIASTSGSHAVAITERHLVVSRDPHTEAQRRSVLRIDLGAVSYLEIGCALALGWFVVRFSGPERRGTCPVLFSGQGMDHFRAAVRAYRGHDIEERAAGEPRLAWPDVWFGVPAYLRTELEALLAQGEPPLAVLRSPERWTTEKRLWRSRSICASSAGLLIATPRGLLWAASEPRMRPDALSFGVNVTVVHRRRVRGASIGTRAGSGVLRVCVGEGWDPYEFEVPFEGKDVRAAENIVHMARTWRGDV